MTSIRIASAAVLAVAALLAGSHVHSAQTTHAVHVVASAPVSNEPVMCCGDE
ncbi:MAG TPA: hypothetical protein VEL03_22910 [Streptosporangiaceae bacterium]|nr:hypothetical protein [Streptosporangiaceae bacterium]